MYKRDVYKILLSRLNEPRHFIQVLAGPRQVGKTTLIQQVVEKLSFSTHYASADEPILKNHLWIEQQWDNTRLEAKNSKNGALLILDEIQKIPDWSTIVKKLWDKDTRLKLPLKVVLLGSSPLLIQQGLTESLAGRFEIIYMNHWSYDEMKKAFGWNLEQYIYFGGYPGAAHLINNQARWRRYIIDSLIETTISRDVLLMNVVKKPALLRRLFHLGCSYSGQILSYQKMIGQLYDAGNTTTLAHYLDLLAGVGMLTGLQKYANKHIRQRGSSPKFQVFNTALISVQSNISYQEALQDREFWGRLSESAIGAHLVNSAAGSELEVFYWREGNQEVDFILRLGKKIVAIEVKSGYRTRYLSRLKTFVDRFHPDKILLVSDEGISHEKFLSTPPEYWFG